MKYAIIDIETTGGNFKTGQITEIAVFLHNGTRQIDVYQTLVNPQVPIPPFITKLTGISDAMVETAPTFPEVAEELLRITDGAIFVAHNVNFDYGYIREAYRQLGIEFKRKKLCTVQLSRRAFPGLASYSLDKITRELGISLPGHHRAGVDAEATMLLFEKILHAESEKGLFDANAGIPNTEGLSTPLIDKDFLSSIPDECGVYRFYDKDDQLLFAKRAENVLTAICDKLNQTDTQTADDLREKLYRIDYDLTGSGLLAQLLEAHDVVGFSPEFNFGRFSMKAHFGMYSRNADGGVQLMLMKRRRGSRPERVFANFYEGLDFLKAIATHHQAEITQLPYGRKTVPGIFIDADSHASEREKAGSYILIDEGRHVQERTIILVEKDVVVGYGYYETDAPVTSFGRNDLQFGFQPLPELEMVVRKFIEKNRYERIVKLN